MIQVVKNEEAFYRQANGVSMQHCRPGRGTVWAKAWRWE